MSKHSHTTQLVSKLAVFTTHRRSIAVFVVMMALLVVFSGTASAHDLDNTDWSVGNLDDSSSVMASGGGSRNDLRVRKYNDLNGDGDRDSGEPYLNDWVIEVYSWPSNTLVGTQTTRQISGNDGRTEFEFSDGWYYVCEVLQDGWENTEPGGTPNANGRVCTNRFYLFNDKTIYFGNHELPPPPSGSVHVFKFHDLNGNGVRDDGEPGLNDWEFTLTGEGAEYSETTMNHPDTNEPGWAWFSEIPVGDYLLCEIVQDGWEVTTPASNCIEVEVVQGAATEIPGGDSTTLTTPNGDSFRVDFLGTTNGGLTWNYRVTELGRRDLSHWVLDVCEVPTDHTGSGYTDEHVNGQADPTTHINGVKWDVDPGGDDLGSAVFSVTFDEPYGASDIAVAVKSGGPNPADNKIDVGTITGPNCEPREIEETVYEFGNVQLADIEVTKTDTADPVDAGGDFSYEITITNNGPATAENVTLHDTLPAGLTFIADGSSIAGPPGAFCVIHLTDPVVVNCTFPDLAQGDTYIVTLHVGVADDFEGVLDNTACGSTTTPESNTDNNCDDEETTVVIPLGSLHVQKYNDYNGNGVHDDDESGLNGWWIIVYDVAGAEVTRQETHTHEDQDGWTWFEELPAGQYHVCEALREGWINTDPGTDRPCEWVEVLPGEETVIDFGNQRLGSLHVRKYHDFDGDGEQDFLEPGLNGWWIVVFRDGQEVARQETHTHNFIHRGWTWFDLPAGRYEVCEEPQEGWINTDPGGDRPCQWVEVRPGHETEIDFGNQLQGHLHVFKYNDRNGNGHRDEGEEGLNGWTIQIYTVVLHPVPQIVLVAEAVTHTHEDEDGWVWFTLPPGLYGVCEVQQDGWENTDPGGPIACEGLIMEPGETDYRIFGNHPLTGSITIVKDTQPNNGRNFTFEGTDPIGDFTLDDDANATLPNSMTFDDLEYGEYTVTETGNFGDAWGLADVVCEGAVNTTFDIDLENNNVTIDLAPGEDVTCTFVNQRTPRIRVRKYEDLNRNGNRNGDEPWLEGWTITLYDDQGGQVNQLVTDSNGRANFLNLEPGTYTVCETQQEFWVNSEPGTIDATYNEPCYEVTVGLGDNENLQFGNWHQTGSLTVTKEVDWFNADPIPNTAFTVCVSGGNLSEPVCEDLEDGEFFTVDDLEPGEYTITEPGLGAEWTMTLSGDAIVVFDEETFVTVTNTHEDICLRQSPDPFNDLNHAGSYLVSPFNHGIVQNLSECFGYYVGIASYQIYDGSVATQTIFDYEDGIWVGPGETIDTADTRLIDLPACWAQVDLFYGDAILDFSTGDRYNERLIDSRWINTGVNCNPPANDPPQNDPPANDPPQNDPPANDPPQNDPPQNDPPANDPPANDPPAEDPPVCTPNPDGDLKHSGSHLNPPFDNGTVTNLSDACTYEVGIASYMVMDGTVATQQMLGGYTAQIGPGETLNLGPVPLAGCTTQVDLFYGYLITDFSGGDRYGNRLIDVRWVGSQFCGEPISEDPPQNDPPQNDPPADIPPADTDGDGVNDDADTCPGTTSSPVDANGCSEDQLDDDGDGVNNVADVCPGTISGPVDGNGCSDTQLGEQGNHSEPETTVDETSAVTTTNNTPGGEGESGTEGGEE